MKGFDSAQPVGGIVDKIKAAGCEFVARYYSRNLRKNLSASEAKALTAAGIGIVSVWEAAGDHLGAFSAAQGTADADAAMQSAVSVGQPIGSTIFFAVDMDVGVADLASHIMPYFVAVNAALKDRYAVGVYGSGLVCTALAARNLVTRTWLGGAMGWSGSRGYASWDIRQGLPSDPWGFGFQIDPDESKGGNFGQWSVAAAPVPIDPPTPVDNRLASVIEEAKKFQQLLAGLDYYSGEIDGAIGPASSAAAMRAWNDWKAQE